MVQPVVRQEQDALGVALREARLAEASHLEAAINLRDSKSLRLQILKDDLLPGVQASPEARDLFDLTVLPGDPPRLWIDLTSYVLMEPDYRTYRFIQDRQDGREVLFESADLEQAATAVRRHMAHRLIARERQLAFQSPAPAQAGYGKASLILAWISGLAFGALAVLAAGVYIGNLKI